MLKFLLAATILLLAALLVASSPLEDVERSRHKWKNYKVYLHRFMNNNSFIIYFSKAESPLEELHQPGERC